MKVFYRVQFKPKGKRSWQNTSWGSLEPDQHYVELSLGAARRGKKDAEILRRHLGKFRIVKITQTTEVIH